MPLTIAILKETEDQEHRVAMVPSVSARLIRLGFQVLMEKGAGEGANLADSAYSGVAVAAARRDMLAAADIVLCVRPPATHVVDEMRDGALLIGCVSTSPSPESFERLKEKSVTSFAMDRIPDIRRAKDMNATISQATLSGYYATLLGATHLRRPLGKLTPAAGAADAAKVLVLGLGPAGLEAAATAHRLGASVAAYDLHLLAPDRQLAAGIKRLNGHPNTSRHRPDGREMSLVEKSRLDALLTPHIHQADLIIVTETMPGQAALRLMSEAQMAGMKRGAIIIDMLSENGVGAGIAPQSTQTDAGVKIIRLRDAASYLSNSASELYARNLLNFMGLLIKDGVISLDWSDGVLARTVLTHAGEGHRLRIEDVRRPQIRMTAKQKDMVSAHYFGTAEPEDSWSPFVP